MAVFRSAREEFLATQQSAEELLIELANGKEINESVMYRLDKLASACSRLCYGNGFESDLSENIHSLIAWCDHLDEMGFKEDFRRALKKSPLRGPW